ncbi:hypothetical protein KUH03_32530 [Sphingobacterium sp. E70]|uniref:hypothetical protein n=1 Tax=Sphingobacterium sp. E70 TaxID=2853439 RepID=UPI00211C6261|nr:hypothetical protein [Sphingobacterium sp. E70]ULT23824.1 hypothetical protein KUH03_32530 [Sphingobacterium sp. E70]
MLNVGPKPDGSIPDQAGLALRNAGAWIKRYPETVYGAQASPWKHALPWGDATVQGIVFPYWSIIGLQMEPYTFRA